MPAAKRSLPPEIMVACPSGSTCATSSRHAIEIDESVAAASVSGASEPLPITAMPTLPVLKPWVCAPMTGRSMPPARPSKTRP